MKDLMSSALQCILQALSIGRDSNEKEAQEARDRESIDRERQRNNAIATSINSLRSDLAKFNEEQKASETRREAREKVTLVGLFGTAIVAVFGATYQHQDTLAALEHSESGWLTVLPENVQFSIPDSEGNRLAYGKIWMRNRGKTPLTAMISEIKVQTVGAQTSLTFDYQGPRTKQEIGILYPDYSKSDDAELAFSNLPPLTVFLLDEAMRGDGVNHPRTITPQQYQDLISGRQFVVVYAKTSFMNIFEKKHWVYSCAVMSPPKDIAPDIDAAKAKEPMRSLIEKCLQYNTWNTSN